MVCFELNHPKTKILPSNIVSYFCVQTSMVGLKKFLTDLLKDFSMNPIKPLAVHV